MGQYKVPQNVEAEDKIIGPLTFKQFIYALIGVAWAGVSFAIFRKVPAVMIIVGAPVATLFLLLAFYSRDGQNFEQLLIAMVGFFSQARKRLWMKEEVVEAFHVEPKAVVAEASQRDPTEVRSELERLGSLIDSRGRNDAGSAPGVFQPTDSAAPAVSTPADEQIVDLQESPLAKNLAHLLEEASQDVRQEAIDQMSAKPTKHAPEPQISTSVTSPSPDGILNLATERDDLTVSQLAATATRMAPLQEGQSVELRNNGSQTK